MTTRFSDAYLDKLRRSPPAKETTVFEIGGVGAGGEEASGEVVPLRKVAVE